MKVIIAGSRQIVPTVQEIDEQLGLAGYAVTEEVCGGAFGVDVAGKAWAEMRHIPITTFLADWSRGKGAGPTRNIQMADYADALLAIWDGQSRGTSHMITTMQRVGKPVWVWIPKIFGSHPRAVSNLTVVSCGVPLEAK
jgi:hypothetical protein